MASQAEHLSRMTARENDSHQFEALAEPYRRELRAYCYRLLGSLEDAEDLVQETMFRAWRRLETFEGRASFRAWLYKIATNACFDAMDKSARRRLPTTQSPPANPQDELTTISSDPVWLDPFPDEWLDETTPSAEARYSLQESVSLAFMMALQVLPPRQRTVLVLCDVLDWQASETAELLNMSVSAVSSALHRARVTLSKQNQLTFKDTTPRDGNPQIRTLLERYVQAWETVDVAGLVALLKEDATFSMPPFPTWFQTREHIAAFFASSVFTKGTQWRLRPIRANGQLGFAAYQHNPTTNCFEAHAIHVLKLDDAGIIELTAFLKPELFGYFDLPKTIEH